MWFGHEMVVVPAFYGMGMLYQPSLAQQRNLTGSCLAVHRSVLTFQGITGSHVSLISDQPLFIQVDKQTGHY